jgi:hypothetical protein
MGAALHLAHQAPDEYTRYVTEPLPPAAVEALRRSLQGNPKRLKVRMPALDGELLDPGAG